MFAYGQTLFRQHSKNKHDIKKQQVDSSTDFKPQHLIITTTLLDQYIQMELLLGRHAQDYVVDWQTSSPFISRWRERGAYIHTHTHTNHTHRPYVGSKEHDLNECARDYFLADRAGDNQSPHSTRIQYVVVPLNQTTFLNTSKQASKLLRERQKWYYHTIIIWCRQKNDLYYLSTRWGCQLFLFYFPGQSKREYHDDLAAYDSSAE